MHLQTAINDAKGRPHLYEAMIEEQAASLNRLDSDETISVRINPDRCTCRDFQYRRPDGGCKHLRWLRDTLKETPMTETPTNHHLPAVAPAPPPMSLQDTLQLGDVLARSGFFRDAGTAAQTVTKILMGRELGFGPMASLTGVHIIEGRPSVGAHLMAALIKGSGRYDYRIIRCDREACELEFLLNGKPLGKAGLTYQEAAKSGLAEGQAGKPKANWSRHADDMLFARAISKGFRRFCPDLTFGVSVYTTEEMEDEHRGQVVEGEVVPPSGPESMLPPPAANGPPPQGPPPEECVSEDQHRRLVDLLLLSEADAAKLLEYYHVPTLKNLPAMHFDDCRFKLLAKMQFKPVTAAQMNAIQELTAAVEGTEKFGETMKEAGAASGNPFDLNRRQAHELIARLRPQPLAAVAAT